MNKVDTILTIERIREAVRMLPESANVFGWTTGPNYDSGAPVTELHLTASVEWPAVFDGKHYDGWTEKRICITPFVYAWWAERTEATNGDD